MPEHSTSVDMPVGLSVLVIVIMVTEVSDAAKDFTTIRLILIVSYVFVLVRSNFGVHFNEVVIMLLVNMDIEVLYVKVNRVDIEGRDEEIVGVQRLVIDVFQRVDDVVTCFNHVC